MSYINNLDFKSVPKSEDVERNILNLKLAEIRLFSLGTKDRKFFFYIAVPRQLPWSLKIILIQILTWVIMFPSSQRWTTWESKTLKYSHDFFSVTGFATHRWFASGKQSLYCAWPSCSPDLITAWPQPVLWLLSRAASRTLATMPSCEKCPRFAQYLSIIEW